MSQSQVNVTIEDAQPVNVTVVDAQPINVSLGESVNIYSGGSNAVSSVNGQTGTVVLTADDVGADPSGSADAAESNARSYTDTGLATKVDKITGKGLSTNDYTTAEQTKLAGVAAGAEVNVNPDWDAESGDGQILNKPTLGTAAATDSTDYATAAQGAAADSAVQPADIAEFETSTQLDARDTADRNRSNHTGTQAISTVTGLQTALDGKQASGDYATSSDLSSKQDTLVSGTNIKTINGDSILGEGDLSISGGDSVSDASTTTKGIIKLAGDLGGTADLPTVPALDDKANTADLADVATSGSYDDLSDTPTIPSTFDDLTDGTTNKAFTATLKSKLDGIESSADVTDADNVGSSIHGATAKTTPIDADEIPLIDSAASNVLKKLTWSNLKATLKTYLDTLYQPLNSVLTATTASFTTTLKTKLDGIASGAEVNVQSDWNEATTTDDSYIKNKPTLGTAAATNSTDYATAAQGATADTAIQPADLADVATSGSYTDLTDKPTIPTNNDQLTNGAGYITGYTETDPVYSASAAASITTGDITKLGNLSGTNTGDQDLSDLVQKGSLVYNVKDHGAIGDGTTDDTAAITTALALGGTTFFPAGTYLVTGLTLGGGAHLVGVGAGNYGTTTDSSQRSIIKLDDDSNAATLSIPAGNAYGIIENLEIDGNGSGQTTDGIGIDFVDASAGEECGWQLRHIEMYSTYGIGIYVGNNRRSVYGEHVIITSAGQHGIQITGSDSTWIKLMVGSSGSGWKGIVASGYMTRFIGGEVWSTPGGSGAIVVSPEVSFVGMGFDHNGQEGILLGSGSDSVTIIGCIFHSNSQDTDNTYSDIKVDTSGTYAISGNSFGPLDGGITNKRKYCIEVGSYTANVSANSYVSSANGTGFCDTPDNIAAPVANGGTGSSTAAGARANLELDNLDNTSDADKPISTATQTALDGKVNGTTTITVGTTAPSSPATGDLWIDTSA